MITELRRYRVAPGRLDAWLAFFSDALREHALHGIRAEYAGVDRETGTVVWLRSFDDEADRVARKAACYHSDWWRAVEPRAMADIVEYDVTFLDAAFVHPEGDLQAVPWPSRGARAGSTGDDAAEGWIRSSRSTFVRAAS